MNNAHSARLGDVRERDRHALHDLLDRLGRDEGSLLVVEVVWFQERHRVLGRLAGGREATVPFVPAIIRCGPGARPIRAGMRLRLLRDSAGVSLEHCIP
jgi:hypothetical protein